MKRENVRHNRRLGRWPTLRPINDTCSFDSNFDSRTFALVRRCGKPDAEISGESALLDDVFNTTICFVGGVAGHWSMKCNEKQIVADSVKINKQVRIMVFNGSCAVIHPRFDYARKYAAVSVWQWWRLAHDRRSRYRGPQKFRFQSIYTRQIEPDELVNMTYMRSLESNIVISSTV